jgi:hypothetical protein
VSLLRNPLKEAKGVGDAAQRRFDEESAKLATMLEQQAETLDFDQRVELEDKIQRQRRIVGYAQDSLNDALAKLAAATAESEKVEGDRRHAEVQAKIVPAHKKSVLRMKALIDELRAEARASDGFKAQIDAANAVRGDRPFIVDAEAALRGTPDRTEPAVFEDRIVFEDAAGRTPSQYRRNAAGEDVPVEQGFERKVKRVQVRAERFVPGSMPMRYAEVLKLLEARLQPGR